MGRNRPLIKTDNLSVRTPIIDSVQARLLDLLRGLVRDMGLSAIVVTHDLAVTRLAWQAHGLCYGVSWPEPGGGTVLVDLSRRCLADAARVFPGLGVIHVGAEPALCVARLAARGREDRAQIADRIAREAVFDPGNLRLIRIDNSGDPAVSTIAFLAALDEVVP